MVFAQGMTAWLWVQIASVVLIPIAALFFMARRRRASAPTDESMSDEWARLARRCLVMLVAIVILSVWLS